MNLIRRILVRLFGYRFARVGDWVYCSRFNYKGRITRLHMGVLYPVKVESVLGRRYSYSKSGRYCYDDRKPTLEYIGGSR